MTTPLERVLVQVPVRVIACSGGVDSLVLATVAHRAAPSSTLVVHAVSPAVPGAATARTMAMADAEGWSLEVVRTGEFADERYVSNPTDRCYHCKRHLYETLAELADRLDAASGVTLLSGANRDDLGEYRPGLEAAAERGVRHPFIEAGMGKEDIRAVARRIAPGIAELAASPCLASRLYTGTRVTPSRLRAVDAGEELIRRVTGVAVVRCRLREQDVVVEVGDHDRAAITDDVLARVTVTMRTFEPTISAARLDDRPYRPGQAVILIRPPPPAA
jgi:uncharacterized protein